MYSNWLKSTLVVIVVLILSSGCIGMKSSKTEPPIYFSGEIHSTLNIVPTHHNVNVDSIKQALWYDEVRYFIQDSVYKSMHYKNGELIYYFLYDPSTKMMYDYNRDEPYITYRDSRINSSRSSVKKLEQFRDSSITVSGVSAYLAKTEYSGIKSDVFYAPSLKINTDLFLEHSAGGWNKTLLANGGLLPIKTIIYNSDHKEIKTAESITWGEQPLSFFKLSKDIEVFASYSALTELPEMEPPSEKQIDCYQSTASKIPDIVDGEFPVEYLFRLIITEDGSVKYPSAVNPEYVLVGKIGEQILNECGFKFQPGKINNQFVGSEITFRLPLVL